MDDSEAGRSLKFDLKSDLIVVGSGATGLTAAITAAEKKKSVVVIEANYDIGGHAIQSGGNVPLGGGTSLQKKHGISDSADLIFSDLTSGQQLFCRYNDRKLARAFADNSSQTFEWLISNGVLFHDETPEPEPSRGLAIGTSANRMMHVVWNQTVDMQTPTGAMGAGLVRPLEASARKKGVRFLLNFTMTKILREDHFSGRVVGIVAKHTPRTLPGETEPLRSYANEGNINLSSPKVKIGSNNGVVIATGGNSSNVNFRRIFDPRLTDEYQVVGEPYSFQDGSGEIAAMKVGASLWGTANQTLEFGLNLVKASTIGCRYGYPVNPRFAQSLELLPNSPIFPLIRATGLLVTDYQDVILVNQAGLRFWDETKDGYSEFPSVNSFLGAALNINPASIGPEYPSGPIWAIFDSNAVKRENWKINKPAVDPDGYFFSAETIEELAPRIRNPFQRVTMSAEILKTTVKRYNSFVDIGMDQDFGKPKPRWKIDSPPFYAAFATPVVHDTRAGLRINEKCQVLDFDGSVIPGLYCGGESAGGLVQHGLARCLVQGRIAGLNAVS